MQLDTRLPLLAAQQPAMQFQPETRLESLGKIAPAINAMRQLQAQQIDMETELRKRQAFDQFRSAAQQAGLSGDLGQLAQVFFTHGQSAEHFKIGTDLMRASQEEARNRRLFGTGEGGEPAGVMPAARPAAAAPAAIQAPASQVAPEMAFYGAGGGRPANAMMAMEAPAAPMPAARPAGMYRYGNRTFTQAQLDEMLGHKDTRSVAEAIIKANEPTALERELQVFGQPTTLAGLSALEAAKRAPVQETTTYREYQKAKDEGFKGTFLDYQERLRKAGASNISVDTKAETAERVARANQLVKDYNDVATAARVARRSLMSIEGAQGVLDKGFTTGFGTETIAKAASVLAALGVQSAEKYATNAQTFLSEARKVLLDRQLEQKGPQTENDAKRIDESFVRLGNTPEANKFILAVAKAQAEQSSDQQKFYDAFYRKNKTYDGAEEAWLAGDGGKSIFQRPSLRSFVVPQTGAAPGRPPLQEIFRR